MPHHTEPPTPNDPKQQMRELCENLALTLSTPTADKIDALERQAKLLDELLYAVMRKNIQGDMKRGYFDDDHLTLALRIQKQCVDTMKAASQIEYMRKLNAPHPPIFLERTSEAENES